MWLSFGRKVNLQSNLGPTEDTMSAFEEIAESATNTNEAIVNPQPRSGSTWRKVAPSISLLGWLILASKALQFAFTAIPPKLLDPAWQLNVISGLLDASFPLLIGLLLMSVSRLMDRDDRHIAKGAGFARSLASALAIILVLSIPVQLYLGQKLLKTSNTPLFEQIATLNTISKGVQAAKNEQELRLFLANLPEPQPLPEKLDKPFKDVKEIILTNASSRINAIKTEIEKRHSQSTQTFITEFIRNLLLSLILATAFSVIPRLTSSRRPNMLSALLLFIAKLPV